MSETSKREVKPNTEVLHLEDEPNGDETVDDEDDDLDEEVVSKDQIPKDGEEASKQGGTVDNPEDGDDAGSHDDDDSEEDDTEEGASAKKSSPEGQGQDSEPEGDETDDALSHQTKKPALVPGETARERALRAEVARLRGLNRKKSVSDMVEEPREAAPQSPDVRNKLKELGYSDDEIEKAETLIDTIASSQGYVKQSQNYQGTVNEEVDAFINANPEYKPANDLDDLRWDTFQRHLKSGLYNINGKTREQLQTIFKKVKADVDSELGEPETQRRAKADESEERKKAAQQQKIKSVSHSGGTKAASEKSKKTIDPNVRKMFKGFDDEDLE